MISPITKHSQNWMSDCFTEPEFFLVFITIFYLTLIPDYSENLKRFVNSKIQLRNQLLYILFNSIILLQQTFKINKCIVSRRVGNTFVGANQCSGRLFGN